MKRCKRPLRSIKVKQGNKMIVQLGEHEIRQALIMYLSQYMPNLLPEKEEDLNLNFSTTRKGEKSGTNVDIDFSAPPLSAEKKIEGTEQAWESGALGESAEHAVVSQSEVALDECKTEAAVEHSPEPEIEEEQISSETHVDRGSDEQPVEETQEEPKSLMDEVLAEEPVTETEAAELNLDQPLFG